MNSLGEQLISKLRAEPIRFAIPADWSCVRCNGTHGYCPDCGDNLCVCPEGYRPERVICEHDLVRTDELARRAEEEQDEEALEAEEKCLTVVELRAEVDRLRGEFKALAAWRDNVVGYSGGHRGQALEAFGHGMTTAGNEIRAWANRVLAGGGK